MDPAAGAGTILQLGGGIYNAISNNTELHFLDDPQGAWWHQIHIVSMSFLIRIILTSPALSEQLLSSGQGLNVFMGLHQSHWETHRFLMTQHWTGNWCATFLPMSWNVMWCHSLINEGAQEPQTTKANQGNKNLFPFPVQSSSLTFKTTPHTHRMSCHVHITGPVCVLCYFALCWFICVYSVLPVCPRVLQPVCVLF